MEFPDYNCDCACRGDAFVEPYERRTQKESGRWGKDAGAEENAENPRQDVIELLKKILSDEMEHIALLSALQADKASSFVAEDSKEEFNEIIDGIQ